MSSFPEIDGKSLVFALVLSALVVGLITSRMWSVIEHVVAEDYDGVGTDYKRRS